MRKQTYFPIVLLLALWSCLFGVWQNKKIPMPLKNEAPQTYISIKKDTIIDYFPTHKAMRDTLNKYKWVKRKFIQDNFFDYRIYINRTAQPSIAILTAHGESYGFTQKNKTASWSFLGNLSTESHPTADLVDLNGDSLKDIRIDGSGKYPEFTVFLYDRQKDTYRHNSNYDLPRITYDPNTKLIYSCEGHKRILNKKRYKITGNHLTIVDECQFNQKGGYDFNLEDDDVMPELRKAIRKIDAQYAAKHDGGKDWGLSTFTLYQYINGKKS